MKVAVTVAALALVISVASASGTSTKTNTVPVVAQPMGHKNVPEPATMTVLGLGALAVMRRRKKA